MHCLTGSASEKNKNHILAFKCCGKLFRTGPSAVCLKETKFATADQRAKGE